MKPIFKQYTKELFGKKQDPEEKLDLPVGGNRQ
jgi:hypothetical protein